MALGASIIEKHFTLDRSEGGVDSSFSMEPSEMEALVIESERAWKSLGKVTFGPSDKEKKSLLFRRSLYIVKDLCSGDTLDESNMRSIRPGLGLSPKYYENVLGKKVRKAIKRGTAVTWDLME